jgi:DNA-binding CsgD family transcriptional regulator/tetratricopeptide (TPR) repeat protein
MTDSPALNDVLVERESELELLHRAFAETAAGRGRMALVTAEAGGGKSALIRRFCAELPGHARVLRGGCDALATPRPLGPFADVAVQSGGQLAALLEEGCKPGQVLGAVRDELANGSTVLVLEDLHWADEATLDVVSLLGRRIETIPVLVIATFRDDEIDRARPLRILLGDLATASGVRRLSLAPLSEDALTQLAAGHSVDPCELHRLTGGNPFFVNEVLEAGGDRIPASVQDVVLARAARLSPVGVEVLELVAIAPPHLEFSLAERVCPDASAAVDECFAAGVLVDDGVGIAFRHELARAVCERALAPRRRRQLHRLLLAALSEGPGARDLARAAHHAEAAGDGAAVLRFAPGAGAKAASLGANREAVAQYARALRFADALPPGHRAELLERQGEALYNTDDQMASMASLREAVECHRAVGDVYREVDVLSRMVWSLTCVGLTEEAEELANHAVGLLEPLPPSRRHAVAYASMALLGMYANDVDGAITWGNRAMEFARRFGDNATFVDALITVGTVECLNDRPSGTRTLEEALELARAGAITNLVLRALNNLAEVAVGHRSHRLAARYLDEALEVCAEPDLDLWRVNLLCIKARNELNAGRWSEAAELGTFLAGDLHDSPRPRFEGRLVLALVRARRGDPGVREPLEAAADSVYPDEAEWLAPLAATRAEIAYLGGLPDEVDNLTRRAFELASDLSWPVGELACWRRRAGVDDPASKNAAEPWALELAGRHEDAAAAWLVLGCRYEAALALGHSADEGFLRQAHDMLQELDAAPATAIVKRRLREIGVRDIRRGPRPSTSANAAGLTSRECEILALAAEGLRNGEIANRLFLSPRTVDNHMSAILRKLGARNRVEAAAKAATIGLTQDK